MTDLPLFMESAPHSGMRTSKDAAADIRPHVATLRSKVLAYVAACGERGATAQEVETALQLSGNTVRPRLVELRETGCLVPTEATRKTTAGRNAAVWRFVK